MQKIKFVNGPIFIRASGRTGGTLMTTILDAHPNIAMSYEIYQDRLINDVGVPVNIPEAIDFLKSSKEDDQKKWVKTFPDKNFRTFLARARRGGLKVDEILHELDHFQAQGCTFETLEQRLRFIERLMVLKMDKFSKQRWGGKVATVSLEDVYKHQPRAYFLAMVRDGRDVLASRLKVGNFQTNAYGCALDWRQSVMKFKEFISRSEVCGMEINYEALVSNPSQILQQVCDFIEVAYTPDLLMFHQQQMTLFSNPHGHLSYQQIQKGLNSNSIGRWRSELTSEDIKTFESLNADLLSQYGYIS